jgi:PilZ domain
MATSPQPDQEELLTLALGVLPDLPTEVEVLSEDGGAFAIRLNDVEESLLHGFGPRDHVRKELHLLARITDESRGRYEIELEVREEFFVTGKESLMHMAVSGVRRRKMRRAAPRVPVSESASARVVFCRTLPRDSTVDVKLADISTTGVAFISRRPLDPGDLLSLSTRLAKRPLTMEARVIRCDPAPYDRFRIGCELTDLEDDARDIVAGLAAKAPSGSAAERRPEVAEARARLREKKQA